jgi:hypothetical protein
VYAFIEKEECWEEEETRGQDWQIVDLTFAFCADLPRSYAISLTQGLPIQKKSRSGVNGKSLSTRFSFSDSAAQDISKTRQPFD